MFHPWIIYNNGLRRKPPETAGNILPEIPPEKNLWHMVFRRKKNNKVSGGSQNGITDFRWLF